MPNFSQQQLYKLYGLLYGNQPSSPINANSVLSTLELYCNIRKSDVEYSIGVINNTNRPGLFYSYVDFLFEKLGDLERVERIAPELFASSPPSSMMSRVREQLPAVELTMWERLYSAHTAVNGKRQSDKMRITRIRNYFNLVDKFEPKACDDVRALFRHQRSTHADDLK